MRGRSWFSIALDAAAILVMGLGFGCAGHQKSVYTFSEMHVDKPVKRLVAANPMQFTRPFTLLVLADESGTCSMREAKYWRDWEEFMLERELGFLLVTSQQDSVDMVVAGQLDSVHSPTLVLPSCKRYLRELGIPFVPINLLVDSTGDIRLFWSALMDSTASRLMMDTISSFVADPVRSKPRGRR
jgi:hypothetical protein